MVNILYKKTTVLRRFFNGKNKRVGDILRIRKTADY